MDVVGNLFGVLTTDAINNLAMSKGSGWTRSPAEGNHESNGDRGEGREAADDPPQSGKASSRRVSRHGGATQPPRWRKPAGVP